MTVEKLEALGVEQMADERIKDFLRSQGTGVLALPTDDEPYILPLSYGYDGERRLYFTYLTDENSRKAALSSGQRASFLVYAAETPFVWRSVICAGPIHDLPRSEWDAHDDAMADNAWHPNLLERAFETQRVQLYRFDIGEWSGLSHNGLPPALEDPVN